MSKAYRTDEEIAEAARIAALLGAEVHVRGAWVWAYFDRAPVRETINALKQADFHWARHKEAWVFRGRPCAARQSMPLDYIVAKYGDELVTA